MAASLVRSRRIFSAPFSVERVLLSSRDKRALVGRYFFTDPVLDGPTGRDE
jgi:hypothetical protein